MSLREKQALVEQEAEAVKKLKDLKKNKEKNIEAIISNQLKEGHIMKGAIQYQNEAKYSQVQSKIGSVIFLWKLLAYCLDFAEGAEGEGFG